MPVNENTYSPFQSVVFQILGMQKPDSKDCWNCVFKKKKKKRK